MKETPADPAATEIGDLGAADSLTTRLTHHQWI